LIIFAENNIILTYNNREANNKRMLPKACHFGNLCRKGKLLVDKRRFWNKWSNKPHTSVFMHNNVAWMSTEIQQLRSRWSGEYKTEKYS